jgi:hypothetical protein
LREGTHVNRHLQFAWNRYGAESFECSVLEIVPSSDLLEAEQSWIDKTKCTDRSVGFNISDIAGSPGDVNSRIWEGFIDPSGNEVTIVNLFDFCRQHKLDFPSMHKLAMGKSKLKSYKGWSHRNSVRRRDYVKTYNGFIAPDGQLIGPVTNLAAFCRENGLDNTHMVALARGRLSSHRGWTFHNGKQRSGGAKTYTGFVDSNGTHVAITNLLVFCRENNLDVVHMHEVKSGKRKSHKGWTWKENEDQTSR